MGSSGLIKIACGPKKQDETNKKNETYIPENRYHFAYLLHSLHVMNIHFPVLLRKYYHFILTHLFTYTIIENYK